MTKEVAGSLPESGLSQTEGDSGAHSSGASSSAENLGAGESRDSASRTEDAEVEEPGSGPSREGGLSQETPSTSGGTRDSEAASDNASLSSDDATPIANGSIAGLEWAQPDLDEDQFDDADSALGDDRLMERDNSASSTQSLSSSVLQYRTIHGRRYHSLRGDNDTEYWQPNDEQQNLYAEYSHHANLLLLDGRLFLAPIPDNVQNVLDVGTGIGQWAIDFGDAHPHAQVRGVDLSPIQPAWIPPNVLFEIDDIAQEWTYQPNHFDFIYLRSLHGCIKDWDAFFREAYKCCKPGGWVETFHMDLKPQSDDGSVRPGMAMLSMYEHLVDAGRRMGRSMDLLRHQTMVRSMEAAGFVDLRETNIKKPITGSFGDRKMREIGGFQHAAMTEGLEGHVLGWPLIQIQLMLARVRTELASQRVHPWTRVQIVYARKPE
ncbi:S-adenosyl-L-methionine-dependent methyltransferase [Apiospora marii]|uniref:S-adenosyl-L-methionine-dependent methyltransferase n=1 Tax=Apiospora marii TaxID=335849 RepID=A0ABR1SF67_9PEZI